MTMKKILMAAVAVSVLTASAASAASISTAAGGTTFAGVNLVPTAGTVPEAYTIANEVNLTTTTAGTLALTVEPTAPIGVGNYLVTFNITGGTFDTTGVTGTNLVPTGGTSTVPSTSTITATSVSFLWNVTAVATPVSKLVLTIPVKTGTTRTPIAVSGSIVTQLGLVAVDGGAIAPVTIVDYRDGITFAATPVNQTLSLASSFKKFYVASPGPDLTEANIASGVKFALNTGANATDVVYKNATGTVLATTDVSTAVLTLAGDTSAFDFKIGALTGVGTQGADAVATPNVITAAAAGVPLGALQGAGAFLTLAQKATAVSGNASAYSVTPVITMPAGLTPLTFASKALGSVSLEGTNFIASWVGDNSNGINYSIRLGNKSATAVSSVTVALLNPYTTGTSGSVASTATCSVGPLPASGELVITSATLTGCFGAFKRSDVRITIQGLSSVMTAKMRTVAAGVVTEQTLGNGVVDAAN